MSTTSPSDTSESGNPKRIDEGMDFPKNEDTKPGDITTIRLAEWMVGHMKTVEHWIKWHPDPASREVKIDNMDSWYANMGIIAEAAAAFLSGIWRAQYYRITGSEGEVVLQMMNALSKDEAAVRIECSVVDNMLRQAGADKEDLQAARQLCSKYLGRLTRDLRIDTSISLRTTLSYLDESD